jgi:hypothetical protein
MSPLIMKRKKKQHQNLNEFFFINSVKKRIVLSPCLFLIHKKKIIGYGEMFKKIRTLTGFHAPRFMLPQMR